MIFWLKTEYASVKINSTDLLIKTEYSSKFVRNIKGMLKNIKFFVQNLAKLFKTQESTKNVKGNSTFDHKWPQFSGRSTTLKIVQKKPVN